MKHLVLTHMVPGPNSFLARRLFLAGVRRVFSGEVTLGEDGTQLDLAAASPG